MPTSLKSSELFGLLGSMYLCKPTKEALAGWRAVLGEDAPTVLANLKDALLQIDLASERETEDLLWEYTRLFIGPYRLPCPPWESVYTSPKKMLMQEAFDAVRETYAQAGLEVGDPNVLPDHVGAELNFLAILLEKAETGPGNDGPCRRLAQKFFEEHIRNWIPRFTVDLEDAADLRLYKSLARTTRQAVQDFGEDEEKIPQCLV